MSGVRSESRLQERILIFSLYLIHLQSAVIPDMIPILGYLDDLLIVPLGIWLVLKMIPPEILSECRQKAEAATGENKPANWVAAGIIVTIWVSSGILAFICIGRILKR